MKMWYVIARTWYFSCGLLLLMAVLLLLLGGHQSAQVRRGKHAEKSDFLILASLIYVGVIVELFQVGLVA